MIVKCSLFIVVGSSDGKTVEIDAQLIIGADGARSSIRNEMMRRPRYQSIVTVSSIIPIHCAHRAIYNFSITKLLTTR